MTEEEKEPTQEEVNHALLARLHKALNAEDAVDVQERMGLMHWVLGLIEKEDTLSKIEGPWMEHQASLTMRTNESWGTQLIRLLTTYGWRVRSMAQVETENAPVTLIVDQDESPVHK